MQTITTTKILENVSHPGQNGVNQTMMRADDSATTATVEERQCERSIKQNIQDRQVKVTFTEKKKKEEKETKEKKNVRTDHGPKLTNIKLLIQNETKHQNRSGVQNTTDREKKHTALNLSQTKSEKYKYIHIEGSWPEWCISSMIYSTDTPFWS